MTPKIAPAFPASPVAHHATSPKDVKSTPQPPKRLRSAFIMFSAVKHKEIRAKLTSQGISEKTTNVAKLVSQAWKGLAPDERKIWEDKAQEDKARYQAEKASFKGTWKVKRRKDPNAPKRPMSAYLAFSNSRRAIATKEHPLATNSEISKILSKLWKEAPPDIKKDYVDNEAKLREQYKVAMAQWKKDEKETKRQNRRLAAAEAKKAPPKEDDEVMVQNNNYHEQLPTASGIEQVLMAATGAQQPYHGVNYGGYDERQRDAGFFSPPSSPAQSNSLPSQYRSPLTELLAGRDPASAHAQLLSHVSQATHGMHSSQYGTNQFQNSDMHSYGFYPQNTYHGSSGSSAAPVSAPAPASPGQYAASSFSSGGRTTGYDAIQPNYGNYAYSGMGNNTASNYTSM